MNAMEKMVASMLGVTPEKMAEMVQGFQTLLTNLGAKLDNIEAQQTQILFVLSEAQKAAAERQTENDDSNSERRPRTRRTAAGSPAAIAAE